MVARAQRARLGEELLDLGGLLLEGLHGLDALLHDAKGVRNGLGGGLSLRRRFGH